MYIICGTVSKRMLQSEQATIVAIQSEQATIVAIQSKMFLFLLCKVNNVDSIYS